MARNLAPLLGLFQCTYFSSIRAEPSNFLLLDIAFTEPPVISLAVV
jgi:hypothetical protein